MAKNMPRFHDARCKVIWLVLDEHGVAKSIERTFRNWQQGSRAIQHSELSLSGDGYTIKEATIRPI